MAEPSAWLAVVDVLQTAKLILLITSPILLPLLLFVYVKIVRRWPIKAVILERRGSNLVLNTDRMRREIGSKDGLYKYRFKKERTDAIIIVDYDWIIHTIEKPTNLFEKISSMISATAGTVFLYKYGSKQYKPIKLKQDVENIHFQVIDWDNMNFLVQEQRNILERWKDKTAWMQKYLIPIMIIAAALLVFIFSAYFGTEMWMQGQTVCAAQQPPPPVENPDPNIPVAGDLFGPAS